MKPKYHLFKNTKYAFEGLKEALKSESSFKLEFLFVIPVIIILFLKDLSFIESFLLISSFGLILIVELINSAIEAAVDLITNDFHELAKKAKDYGSAAVFITILLHLIYIGFLFLFR